MEGKPTEGRFTEVAGQVVTVQRPARGFLMVVNHDGKAMGVSREALQDDGFLLKEVLRELAETSPG